MVNLILTVTRSCNLRCSYCPTAKDGWPSLTPEDARRALGLLVDRYGGGDVKIFGGEPLLVPETTYAALDAAGELADVRRVYLSTNGLGLTPALLDRLAGMPKVILTISLDGTREANRRLRRALPGVADAYDHLMTMREQLISMPRVVVTQTIAPSAASGWAEAFVHLRSLGFQRFNFLPGYYIPWKPEQVTALREGFDAVHDLIVDGWRGGQRLYVRNLFTWAQSPFFNTGLVVDADRTIHSSNVGLSGTLDDLRTETRLGDLDDPPAPESLLHHAARTNALLERSLRPGVWASTLAVDAELTRFCRKLYPEYGRYRRERQAA